MNITFRFLTLSLLFISVLIGLPIEVICQEANKEREEILSIANNIYRSDDRLLNGKYYTPKHFFAEGHPYFLSNDWVESTLFIKGIEYIGIPLKYNIEDDKLIIKAVFENRVSKDILMHNSFVDSLIIGSHIFHNTNNLNHENSIGIAELVYRGGNLTYFKHSVEFKDELSDRIKFGKYLNPKKKLYLFDGTTFYPIQNKKELLSYFSAYEKEVNVYMRKNKIRLKKVSSKQIADLIQFCEQL